MTMNYIYKCVSQGPFNNGLKESCEFEETLGEGTHHCPLCGNLLQLISRGPSVSDILRRGVQQEAEKNKKKKDTK